MQSVSRAPATQLSRKRVEVSLFDRSELPDRWEELPLLVHLPLARAVTVDCERVVVRVSAVRLSLGDAIQLYHELDDAIEELGRRWLTTPSSVSEIVLEQSA